MKISYRTLPAPFAYGTSYLDHDDWTPPTSVTTSVYGTLSGPAANATRREIKLQLPVDDGQKGGFDYTLYVANLFDDLTTASTIQTYNFSFETLCSAYQNTVLQDDTLKSYWRKATEKTNINDENGRQYPDAFKRIRNTFFNYVAAGGRDVAAGDMMLHFMRNNKKKPAAMSPQKFLTRFEKAMKAVKLLDRKYEKEMDDVEAKILFFYAFPSKHVQEYLRQDHRNFDNETLESLKEFFQNLFDAEGDSHIKKQPPRNERASSRRAHHSTGRDSRGDRDGRGDASSSNRSTRERGSSSHSERRRVDSPPPVRNACGFCKGTRSIEWADCTMHNPATGTQTAKDFDALRKSNSSSKPRSEGSAPSRSNAASRDRPRANDSYHMDDRPRRSTRSSRRSRSRSRSRSRDRSPEDRRSKRSSSPQEGRTFVGFHDSGPNTAALSSDAPVDDTRIDLALLTDSAIDQANASLADKKQSPETVAPVDKRRRLCPKDQRQHQDYDGPKYNRKTKRYEPTIGPQLVTLPKPTRLPHDQDYSSSSSDSYCSNKPTTAAPPDFNLKDYPKQCETKQFNIWNNLRASEKPHAAHMEKYVGHYLRLELDELKYEDNQQKLQRPDRERMFFLKGILYEYALAARCESSDEPPPLSELPRFVKGNLNEFIHGAHTRYQQRCTWYEKRRQYAIKEGTAERLYPMSWSYPKVFSRSIDEVQRLITNQTKNPSLTGFGPYNDILKNN